MCIHKGCEVKPSYNTAGESKGLYCNKHKNEGMVDVKSRKCIHPECKVQPCYNTAGESKWLYCSEHKKEGMVNVKHITCIHPECKVRPNYNVEGKKKALYCTTHKKEGMVDITHKKCIHEGCSTIPIYNVEYETKALYCATHKKEGMVDIKNKKCIHQDCNVKPHFNNDGQTKGLYCSTHKKEEMVNVIDKTCKNEWCFTLVKEKYDGYCLYCYINMFPDKPVARNYKTKEYSVVEYIKKTFADLTVVADKIIANGCSKRRPDLLLDLGYQLIIVEIDENQHIDYDCSCENKRTMELSQDVGHRPIVFIRFNPDDYRNQDVAITSCWGIDKRGICSLKKTKQNEWKERLQTLANQITYWLNPDNKTVKTIEIIQLFYDI
jgi:hypothetical protein